MNALRWLKLLLPRDVGELLARSSALGRPKDVAERRLVSRACLHLVLTASLLQDAAESRLPAPLTHNSAATDVGRRQTPPPG